MHNLRTAIHKRGESGGTEIGWSALSQYARCPLQWALAELLPHPSGGAGIASRPGRALIVGTLVHAWLAGWYRSDPEHGNYDADAGFAALNEAALEFSEDDLQQSGASNKATPLAEALDLCRRYAAECCATGPDPDRERFIVAIDDEGPLVERYFKIDLGYGGYYFTSRIDTIGWACDDLPTTTSPGTMVIPEHKTCDVSKRKATLDDLALSGQFSGEAMAVRNELGHKGKIIPYINLIQKRAAARDVCRIWEPNERTDADLEKFRIDVVKRLKHMDADVAEYRELVKAGVPPLTAIHLVFSAHPPRETCAGQGYQCFAYEGCRDRKNFSSWLLGTAPRFPAEDAA